MIYIQCQHSVPLQEIVCPVRSHVESKSVDVVVVDGCVACPNSVQETRV